MFERSNNTFFLKVSSKRKPFHCNFDDKHRPSKKHTDHVGQLSKDWLVLVKY